MQKHVNWKESAATGAIGKWVERFSGTGYCCHCERSEAILPYRPLTFAMREGKIAALRSQ
jgi:hypothetical protein